MSPFAADRNVGSARALVGVVAIPVCGLPEPVLLVEPAKAEMACEHTPARVGIGKHAITLGGVRCQALPGSALAVEDDHIVLVELPVLGVPVVQRRRADGYVVVDVRKPSARGARASV